MTYSTSCDVPGKLGRGIILPFKDHINNTDYLIDQALQMAKAEGIFKIEKNPSIISDWGIVALLINPKIKKENYQLYTEVIEAWKDELGKKHIKIIPEQYKLIDDKDPIVTDDGLLNIKWREEMDDFDILIATLNKPVSNRKLDILEVAEKFRKNKEYIDKNISIGISTFQDNDIINNINASIWESNA